MTLRAIAPASVLLLSMCLTTHAAQSPRLVRSLSGASGKVVGPDFVLDETRNRFVYPADRTLTVYFEWDAPAGDHVLSASWSQPDGRVASVSPDVKIQTTSSVLRSYWIFDIAPTVASGTWTVNIRIDGQPAGSHVFEIAGTDPSNGRVTLDYVFKTYEPSIVTVRRMDTSGRRADSGLGFVIGPNAVATAFQAIDGDGSIEVEFAGGRKTVVTEFWAESRTGDWAVLRADTGDIPAVPRSDGRPIPIGSTVAAFNIEGDVHTLVPVTVGGVASTAGQAARVRFSALIHPDAVGGPLIDERGFIVGIVGGSLTPGFASGDPLSRFGANLRTSRPLNASATSITDVPPTFPAARAMADLRAQGLFTPSLTERPEFQYGGTARQVPKDAANRSSSIKDVTEFSRRDATIAVYGYWMKKDKLSKGEVSIVVFDTRNKVQSNIPPLKVTLRDTEQRIVTSWSPQNMPPGDYRVDMNWDGKPVWRTYIRIVD